MAAFILVVGLLNLVLGYLLALALADPPLFGLLTHSFWLHVEGGIRARLQRPPTVTDQEPAIAEPATPAEGVAPDIVALATELPEAWQHMLRDEGVRAQFLAGGAAHLLRLEGNVYRDRLLAAESRARQVQSAQDPAALEQLAADLRFVNVDWVRKQRQGADLIEERIGRLGAGEPSALKLAHFLRDQASQISEIDREIHTLNFHTEGTLGCRRMLLEMHRLMHMANKLQDEVTARLAEILRCEEELIRLDERFQHDDATGMLNRLGLEVILSRESEDVARPTVAMSVSVDRFHRINQRFGTQVADQALQAAGRIIAELAGTAKATNVIVRQRGCEFLVLSHEQSVEDLTLTGELIRQTFEATGFTHQGTDFSLTLTICLTAIAADNTLANVLSRLESVHAVAAKAGHNRSARWENGAAALALPPAIPIAARSVVLEASTAA